MPDSLGPIIKYYSYKHEKKQQQGIHNCIVIRNKVTNTSPFSLCHQPKHQGLTYMLGHNWHAPGLCLFFFFYAQNLDQGKAQTLSTTRPNTTNIHLNK